MGWSLTSRGIFTGGILKTAFCAGAASGEPTIARNNANAGRTRGEHEFMNEDKRPPMTLGRTAARVVRRMRALFWYLLLVLTLSATPAFADAQDAMSRDLLEINIPQLEAMYRDHKYTVTEVVQWYMARISKYNGIYRAVQNVDRAGALATAAREDAEAKAAGSAPLDWLLDNTSPIGGPRPERRS
jgi:hypothetical protein